MSRAWSFVSGFACVAVCLATLGVGRASAAPGQAPLSAGYRVTEAVLPAGEVARAGKNTVTAAEVRARVGVLRNGARAGHGDAARLREQALYQLLDERYLGERLRAAGLDKDPRVVRMRRVLTRLMLARRYSETTIRPKVAVSEQEVKTNMPRGRDEVRLRLILLRDPDDEPKIRDEAGRGVPFEDLVVRFSATGAGFGLKGDLGFLRKNGLYFDAADEDYLWGLAPGVVSKVIQTKIGPGLAQVVEKRRIPEDAWKAMQEKLRQQIAASRLQVYLRAIADRHPPAIDEAGFRKAGEAMKAEDRFSDFLVATIEGEEIFFHDLDRLHVISYQDIVKGANAKQIAEYYRAFLINSVAPQYAVGVEAERAGVALGDGGREKVEESVGKALIRVAAQDAVRGLAVTEKEIRAEYDAGNEELKGVDRVRLAVLVTETFEQALAAADAYRGGAPFAVLVQQHSIDAKTKQRNGDLGWLPWEQAPRALREEFAGVEKGELFPIFREGDGFHLVLLVDQGEPKPPPLADVREFIGSILLARKREQAVYERFSSLRNGVSVEVDRAQLEKIVFRVAPVMGLSPHGGR